MRRKILCLLLAFSMILMLLPLQVFAADTVNPFLDVKRSGWFYNAVQYSRVNGFFSGTTNTEFTPDGAMTRGSYPQWPVTTPGNGMPDATIALAELQSGSKGSYQKLVSVSNEKSISPKLKETGGGRELLSLAAFSLVHTNIYRNKMTKNT